MGNLLKHVFKTEINIEAQNNYENPFTSLNS